MLCSVLLWLFDLSFFPFFLSFFLSFCSNIYQSPVERKRKRKKIAREKTILPPPLVPLSLNLSLLIFVRTTMNEKASVTKELNARHRKVFFFFFENNLKFNEMLNSQLVLLQKNDHGSLIWLLCCLIGC